MRRTPVLALLVLIPVLSLLAACGASGGKDSAAPDEKTTTSAPAADDDTADPGDDDPTTTAADDVDQDDGGGEVTSAALADLLPTAEEIGDGYTVSDEDLTDEDEPDEEGTDDGSDPTEDAIVDACPGAKILEDLDAGDGNPAEVSREFSTEVDQTIEIALDPTANDFTEEKADEIVDALADCGTIKTTTEDGSAIEMTIEADRLDDHGDYGMEMRMSASFDYLGTSLEIEFRGVVFNIDGTTVSVTATSGLDDATYEVVPGDYDLVPDLAAEMEDRVAAL